MGFGTVEAGIGMGGVPAEPTTVPPPILVGLTGARCVGGVAVIGIPVGGIPDEGVTCTGAPVGGMVGTGGKVAGGEVGDCSATSAVVVGTGGSEGMSGKPG
jgi:hypothetical protein